MIPILYILWWAPLFPKGLLFFVGASTAQNLQKNQQILGSSSTEPESETSFVFGLSSK